MKNKYPLVYIEWEDSMGVSPDWELIKDNPNPRVAICKSVGWLIHDDDKCKVVVPRLTEGNNGCGDMTIPTPAVVKMIKLKEPKAKRFRSEEQ